MRPSGPPEVERAKADGRWDAAYEPQSSATVPDDPRGRLEKNERAREFFATLDSRNRYAILYQIQDAKRPETRARGIEKYVAMLGELKKPYPREIAPRPRPGCYAPRGRPEPRQIGATGPLD